MNESLVITPELASWLLLRYDFFESHEKAELEGLSSEVFESDLLKIGQQVWGTANILEIVEHLKAIVREQSPQKALVPGNIKELVAAYEKRAQEQKNAPPTRQSIGEWLKEQRLREIRNALQTVVGKENAQEIAPLFERTLREMVTREEFVTKDQLQEVISSTLLESAPQLANKPTVEEVALNIANTTLGRRILSQGVEAIGVSRKVVVPRQPVAPTQEPVTREGTRTLREAQLFLRISYLRPSVVKQFFSQLGTLSPFRLLNVVGGKAYANSHPLEAGVQSLLLRGVTIRLLREAITSLKEQAPRISSTDPRLRTLEEIITAMETYQSSHPGNYAKFESRAADKVEVYVATPGEEVPATPGKILRLRSIFDAAGKFQFLRIDTLSFKKGVRALPGIVGRAVSYPFLYTARVFFGRPAGGILHTLGGPRSVAVREASFGVQKGIVNFARGAFRQLGSFVSDVFTRPTLGWLRWGLTGGFGLGAFTLPFPFNFLSGGISGLTGATQLAHSTPNAGSFLSGLRNRFGAGAGGGGSVGRPMFALVPIPIIVFAAFLIIPVLALLNITGAQGTFVGIGGIQPSGQLGSYVGSPYIDIEKAVSPKSSFQNDEAGTVTTYTLIVSPKEDTLKDVAVTDTVSLSNEGGSETLQKNSWPTVSEIKKGETWKQSYAFTIKDSYKDSVITNTVSVTASISDSSERQKASSTNTVFIGNPPLNCPSGWPTPGGYITQGPKGQFSHAGVEAIDISVAEGSPILATHNGTASFDCDPRYGKCVKISSVCNGVSFATLYAHLSAVGINPGELVKSGQQIGGAGSTIGCTEISGQKDCGISTGVHLHYELQGLTLQPPLIPKPVIAGCSSESPGVCGPIW